MAEAIAIVTRCISAFSLKQNYTIHDPHTLQLIGLALFFAVFFS